MPCTLASATEEVMAHVEPSTITSSQMMRDGVSGAFRVMDQASADAACACILDAPKEFVSEACHAVYKWCDELVRSPRVTGPVSQALDSNSLLCIESTAWIKRPGSRSYVSWHQDVTYWGVEPHSRVVSMWIALSPVPQGAGPVKVIPGSHVSKLTHEQHVGEDVNNMLARGQTIPDAKLQQFPQVVRAELAPGEAFLFSGLTVHCSPALEEDYEFPRVGLSLRFVPPECYPVNGEDFGSVVLGDCPTHAWSVIKRPVIDAGVVERRMIAEVKQAKQARGATRERADAERVTKKSRLSDP